ncbi:MAG TPA: asparagine synthetase B, partial [Micromonosporaceae bacterium]|nr:asparagine synthetase B [Micromonosporaceae bacterium]
MCGLLAFFSARGDAGAHRDAISSALECLHHRGPDETGVEVIESLGGEADAVFGHKRLSIIDVASSHEPLPYADGRYLLTFNGEIYNYIELREQLIREFGAEFATQGDGEVVVAGFHHWGEHVLSRLRGMFAFVIWDRQERRAFAARDYFGIKPLHYLETADGVYLASEKKALLPFAPAAHAGDAGVDTANLSHYLTLQYVPEPGTLHQGVRRVGSGEYVTWSPGGGMDRRRWYRPMFRPAPVDDPQKLYDRIRETLRESVR